MHWMLLGASSASPPTMAHSGIKISPAASLRDKSVGLTGSMMRRQRVLTEDEITSVWHAASDAGVFGVLVKLLLATRLNDAMIGPRQNGQSYPASTATITCSWSRPPGTRSGEYMWCPCPR
jgi:hypothetical protein